MAAERKATLHEDAAASSASGAAAAAAAAGSLSQGSPGRAHFGPGYGAAIQALAELYSHRQLHHFP